MDTEISSEHSSDRLVYSVAEAGALLGISRAFAYELVAWGELPVIRLGRRRLVPKMPCSPSSSPTGPTTQPRRGESPSIAHRPSMLRRGRPPHGPPEHPHPGQGVATACRRGSRRGFARAVKAGEAEASDVSGAGH